MVLCWKSNTEDPDCAWKAQNKAVETNALYKYINLAGKGLLLDTFLKDVGGGEAGLTKLIEDELRPLFYKGGNGKLVTEADFARWMLQNEALAQDRPLEEVTELTDEEVLERYKPDEVVYVQAHYACWDLNKRGAVGETALHLCMLQDTPVLNEISKVLISLYPKQALDYYEGEEYYGESALHIAIVYGDFEMVRLLVENGANVNQRATGRFFLPEDQKKGKTKTTNYEGYAYYGEYPLAFAACFGHEEIYDYLVDHGADPNKRDTFGNTVLHMLVINNKIGMFAYAVKHHAKKADMELVNGQNLTPLTLASKLGRNEIFKEIIELQSFEIWRYSNITCSTYPLAPLDTVGPGGKTNWSSALIYITDGDTEEHLEMLEGGVIKQLLDEKWKTYARRRFFERLVLAVLHLLLLSIAIYTRPELDEALIGPTDTKSIIRYVSEIIVCIESVSYLIFQLEEIRSQGLFGFIKNQTSAPAKFIFNVSCVLIIGCIPMRFTGLYGVEVILLSLAAPCAWAFLLFFARGNNQLGPFVVMIYKMFATDMLRFVIIFGVFCVQFSQVFYTMLRGDLCRFGTIYFIFLCGFVPTFFFLFKDIDANIPSFKTLPGTLMQLFQMTLGEFKYDDFSQTRIAILTKAVFFVFAVLVPILLLNMLIAMMGNTYQLVISRSAKEWKRQWAKIIIVLERTFSRKQLLKFQEEYSVALQSGSTEETRGLMVIKTSCKTKARQRKGAITNWKKLANEIKCLIKEQKREGKKGPLDLTSSEVSKKVSERNMLKRQSSMKVDTADEDSSAVGLLSAMTQQLAWEKDIDLTKGGKPKNGDVLLEEDETDSNFTLQTTLDPSPPPLTAVASNGSAVRGSSGVDNRGYRTDTSVDTVKMKDMHTDTGFGNFRKGSKVSPETTFIEDETSGGNNGKTGNSKYKKGLKGTSTRPPTGRSSSGGSKESKDSAFSEDRKRVFGNVVLSSGSKSSLNSSSSLTSLLPTVERKNSDDF